MSTKTAADQDFQEFASWYSIRRHRLTGAPARPTTIRSKKVHLAVCSQETGASDPEFLAHLLSDRGKVEYLLSRLSLRMSAGAMRGVVGTLLQFGEYAIVRGWSTGSTLCEADIPPRNPVRPVTVFSPVETDLLIAAARGRGLRWWAFVTTMADTGRRVGEVLNFEWRHFRLDDSPAYVELPTTKNGQPQYMPLPRRLREDVFTLPNIVAMKADTKGAYGGKFNRSADLYPFPWTYASVLGRWRRFCETAGVPYRSLHCWRHTVITRRIAAGVPIQAVASLAGHSSPVVTLARYSHATSLDYLRYIDT